MHKTLPKLQLAPKKEEGKAPRLKCKTQRSTKC